MACGYFEIGVYKPKTEVNVGTLWRTAYQLGAAGVFTIGHRYDKQSSDTYKTWRHIPLRCYESFEEFKRAVPYDCPVVGVEIGGRDIAEFAHFERCVYLLGAEDNGLPDAVIQQCHYTVQLPAVRRLSYNVAVAGAMVMYDRFMKRCEAWL